MTETIKITGTNGHLRATPRVRQLVVASLLVGAAGTVLAWAQVTPAPSIAGVIGTVEAVGSSSVDLRTRTGLVQISIEQPLTTYHEVPSDMGHVTSGSYVGIPSVKQADGRELAQKIIIFPRELRGAAEGSVMMDSAPGDTTRSRMTNGSVSRPVASRMTNGSVQKGSGSTLVVNYQEGAQNISVPPQVLVTEFVPGQVTLAKGDTIYAATTTGPDGKVATNKIVLIAGSAH